MDYDDDHSEDPPHMTDEDMDDYLCKLVNPVSVNDGSIDTEWKLPYGFSILKDSDSYWLGHVERGMLVDIRKRPWEFDSYDLNDLRDDLEKCKKRPNFVWELDDVFRLSKKWSNGKVFFDIYTVCPTYFSGIDGRQTEIHYNIDGTWTLHQPATTDPLKSYTLKSKDVTEFESLVDKYLCLK